MRPKPEKRIGAALAGLLLAAAPAWSMDIREAASKVASQPTNAASVPFPSPEHEPPCANPAPPPLTVEQMEAYRTPHPPRKSLPPATTPAPIREGAVAKHECFLKMARRGNIDLLFVGDSITDFFGRADRGAPVWLARYSSRGAANFGISGDTTQDVLWRMQNGELEGYKAKVIVLMLGTNNIGRNQNADIAAGDAAIIAEMRKRQPDAKILLLGIFPRGNSPASGARQAIKEINADLAGLADGTSVFYLDIGDEFLASDGTLRDAVMVDGTHPSIFGYAIWADAIEPTLEKWLP